MTFPDQTNWKKLKQTSLRFLKLAPPASSVAVAGLAAWMSLGGSPAEIKRWNTSSTRDTDLFIKYTSKLSETDSGQLVPVAAPNDWSGPARDLYWSGPQLSVYSVPNVPPPHPRPTLKDLGERAQVRAVEAIENASLSPMEPWKKLTSALSDTDEPTEKDPFLFERILVASVAKGATWTAGDRMVWIRIFVRPVNFRFAAYTIASTEAETVKVSSVEATDTRKSSAEFAMPGQKNRSSD